MSCHSLQGLLALMGTAVSLGFVTTLPSVLAFLEGFLFSTSPHAFSVIEAKQYLGLGDEIADAIDSVVISVAQPGNHADGGAVDGCHAQYLLALLFFVGLIDANGIGPHAQIAPAPNFSQCGFILYYPRCPHLVPIALLRRNETTSTWSTGNVLRHVPATIPEGNIIPELCSFCRVSAANSTFENMSATLKAPLDTHADDMVGEHARPVMLEAVVAQRKRLDDLERMFSEYMLDEMELAAWIPSWAGRFPALMPLSPEQQALVQEWSDESLLYLPVPASMCPG